jgi:8-amino-7-oxononanoate synthase
MARGSGIRIACIITEPAAIVTLPKACAPSRDHLSAAPWIEDKWRVASNVPETSPPAPLSLADFFLGESTDPLTPPAGFREWRDETAWAGAVYETNLLGAPDPRVRVLIDGEAREALNFSSYNYLGLARHPEVVAAAQRALGEYGTGACGSPLLSGMTDLHRELETRVSRFLGREATLLFSSGFGGAMGCLAGLLRRGDAAILDQRSHFSLVDGALLSRAKLEFFAHNDPAALDAILARHAGQRCLVAVEGIYSMDGDEANLPALCEVTARHGASVLVDEAHSVLACGEKGRGVSEAQGVEARIGLFYGTFSKAFAGVGGFVSGSAETIDYLRFFARTYGYSCALPPATVAGLLAALDVATRDDSLRRRLRENADYFRGQLHGLGLDTGDSTSHVVPIIVGRNRPLLYFCGAELRRRGLFMATIDYPGVPEDRVRFRASITAGHSRADLDEALNIIEDVIARALKQA